MAYVVYKMFLLLCYLMRYCSLFTSISCKKGLILNSLDLLTDCLSAYTCRKEQKNPLRNYKRKQGLVIIQKCFERFSLCPPSTKHDKTQTLHGPYLITREDIAKTSDVCTTIRLVGGSATNLAEDSNYNAT
jgi:hypothetical protein